MGERIALELYREQAVRKAQIWDGDGRGLMTVFRGLTAAVDCWQLAAAVGPASLLAAEKVVSLTHVPVQAAASCEHHSGSKLPSVHG
jgi:hypothetical protein